MSSLSAGVNEPREMDYKRYKKDGTYSYMFHFCFLNVLNVFKAIIYTNILYLLFKNLYRRCIGI